MVSELRLAGAATIDQANAVLWDFLPRFNNQFRVPAQQDQVAYRSLDSSLHLERVLCFKHTRQVARDNTVKYQLRTLQLLPAQDRPSYAGVKVEVLEQSDGRLMVQHEGKVIAHQEAPPRAGALRATQGSLAPTPELAKVVRNLSRHGLTRSQLRRLASLGAPADQPMDDENGPTSYTPPPRQATPRKQALWKAVHHAKLQGVSLRGIAKQLGHFQKHGQEVRRFIRSAHQPDSQTDHPISNSAPCQRTFSLDNDSDNETNQGGGSTLNRRQGDNNQVGRIITADAGSIRGRR